MLKKIVKLGLLILAAAFIIIQFFQTDKAPIPIVTGETLEATTTVPAGVGTILATSCNDCHTNKTTYPWYAYVQPAGWFLNKHITEGRRKLNFSSWNTYDVSKKIRKLEQVCEQVNDRSMPLPAYLWIHANAVLTAAQAKELCDWATGEKNRLENEQ